MAISRYFPYPFGISSGDLTAIPDSAAMDGSVSYQQGWTPPYEYDLLTNPSALPIPRGQMNQLFYDITLNIQEYQQYGTPQWVTGNTVLYPIYARVYYNGVVYENQVVDNTATPGTDSTWMAISGNASGLPVGTVIDFAGPVVPTNFLNCDGSQVSRATYGALLSVISQVQNGTLSNGLPTVTGLSDTSQMYGADAGAGTGMPIEGTNIPPGTRILSVDSISSITMTNNATGSGSTAIQFFNWGNGDGSTTFNLPDQRRCVKMGSGGSGSGSNGGVPFTATGGTGGEETHTLTVGQMPTHTHTPTAGNGQIVAATTGATGSSYSSGSIGLGANLNTTGGGGSHNNVQPSNIYTQCIKYQ